MLRSKLLILTVYANADPLSICRAIARELPDHYPFVVCTDYILTIVSQWGFPTLELFDSVQRTLTVHMKKLIALHFGKYAHGGLQQHVT